MAHKALDIAVAYEQSCQQINAYEAQTFEALHQLIGQPPAMVSTTRHKLKVVLIGVALSVLAIMPLSYQLASRHVDYKETTKAIPLKPGLNRIGQVLLILGPAGEVLQAQRIKRRIVHKVLNFKNLRAFLGNIAPFVSSLCLCLFFFWYERQQKNPYVLALKRYVCIIFLFVSIWFTYWTLAPQDDPIPHNCYNIASCVALCVALATLRYWHYYGKKLMWFCAKMAVLLLHLFQVRKRRYPRMAMKAMHKTADLEETCRYIQEFDAQTAKVLNGVRRFIVGPKLEREYDDYKSKKIDP